MSLTIYQLEHSPYCIPITAALRSLNQKFKVMNVPPSDRSTIIKLTKGAYYKVPVLQEGSKIIFESGDDTIDVARYVDSKVGEGRLFPHKVEGIQSILIPYIEDQVEGVSFRLTDPKYIAGIKNVVERVMLIRHKERKFGTRCVDQWKKQAPQLMLQLEKLLLPFEKMLQNSPFLLGESPVYTDFALLGIVGNLTYKNFNRIPGRLKNLAQWRKRIESYRYR